MDHEHYYSEQPQTRSERRELEVELRGKPWRFITDRGMFSPRSLDSASRLLIEHMVVDEGQRVLDLGAGYGPIGIVAARLAGPEGRVTMVEVNTRAAEVARENAALNGVDNVDVIAADTLEGLDLPPQDVVVTNPPYRAGKAVVLRLFEEAAAVLKPGGVMWVVGQKNLGVKTYARHLGEIVGPAETIIVQGGNRVLRVVRDPDATAASAERDDG